MSTTVDLGKITASVTVGTTTTGAAGTNASVSNSGTTQDAVLNFTIPRGAQGVQGPQGIQGNTGPAGPTGPQGPMGDVAVITPEQQSAFTMYSVPGQNTDGPMTQKAVTDALNKIAASSVSYNNSQSGLVADNVQEALDEVSDELYTQSNYPFELGTIEATTGREIEKTDGTRIRTKGNVPKSTNKINFTVTRSCTQANIILYNNGSFVGSVQSAITNITAGNYVYEVNVEYAWDSYRIVCFTSGYTSQNLDGNYSVGYSSVFDEIKDEIGTKTVIGTYNGNDYTLSNGYINNNGVATVPQNDDWRKTDFIPIPSGANSFSFVHCATIYVVSDIVFYSSNDESSVIAKYGDYNKQSPVGFWDIPITSIPSNAVYYRLTFVLKISSVVQDISLQKVTFYQDTSIKTTVEKLEKNIGVSYPPYNVSMEKSILGVSATNYEYLYVDKGTQMTITQDGNASLDVYYCPNSQVWDGNNYQTIERGITTNPYTYTFPQDAGCVRIFNNGTSLINVTVSFDRKVTAQEQITINRETIDRIVERVGGVDDSFAQILEFREPITGSLAKMWTSNTLTQASKEKEWLVIMCHGNTVLIDEYEIPSAALDYFRANKINVAAIQYQDLNNTGIVGDGFNKYAWGNDSQLSHVICLYNYLQSHYNFHKSVVLAGCSMGGLAMGALAYKKPFPIAFCLGIGPIPSLMTFWTNWSNKSIIRSAYDMQADGSDDANAAIYFQGHDWWDMGRFSIDNVNYKIGFPNVYLYYGNDAIFRDLMGGTAKYNELCQALKNGGVYSKVEQVGANNTVHDTSTIWTQSVTENVWHNELGTPSY